MITGSSIMAPILLSNSAMEDSQQIPKFLDSQLLCDTIICVDQLCNEFSIEPTLSTRGRLIGLLYEKFHTGAGKVDRRKVEQYLRMLK